MTNAHTDKMNRLGTRRRGSMYLPIIGTATIVAVIGIGAIASTRVRQAASAAARDFTNAKMCSLSAVEDGLLRTATDPDWRTNNPNGAWVTNQKLGQGRYTLTGVDPSDADLTDSDSDSLVLTGIGYCGEAQYKTEVSLTAEIRGYSCLEAALHSNGTTNFNSVMLDSDGILSSNNNFNTGGTSTINADVEAVGNITGSGYAGMTTTGVEPRAIPKPQVMIPEYTAIGTYIDPDSLSAGSGNERILSIGLLSNTSNPFGTRTTNPKGVYIIDAAGTTSIKISDVRIVGTLVVLNADYPVIVEGAVNWEPADPNMPALIVEGSLEMAQDSSKMVNESLLGINLNPLLNPFGGGFDLEIDDTYPSIIKGLIYVTGSIEFFNSARIEGVVVAGSVAQVSASKSVQITYDSIFLNDPPPGFAAPVKMRVVYGSWHRVP